MTRNVSGMNALERRAALSLAGIFALRMLGLFLILPVFSLYAERLPEATPVLVGLAIGIYGLTQAGLQIPAGMLSDRIGRKPVIIGGLLVFSLGSVVAATADSLYWVIGGRALQGAGAIAAAIMALAADLTRESQRTKVMAFIGMSIGLSFVLALVLGPLLGASFGVPGIFWITAVLALIGIGVVVVVVPNPEVSRPHRDAEVVAGQFGRVLVNQDLLRLDFGILILHMLLTALFLVVPLVLTQQAGLAGDSHWRLYLPVLLGSVAAMVPFIFLAERRGHTKPVFLGAIVILGAAELGLWFFESDLWTVAFFLLVFFTAFNLLESMLPSLISRAAPADAKGTALGVYASSQFFGAFLGGLLGGWAQQQFGLHGVFLFCALLTLAWIAVAVGMRSPGRLRSRLIRVGEISEGEARALEPRLASIPGVDEVVVVANEGTAYLKVDPRVLNAAALDEFSTADA